MSGPKTHSYRLTDEQRRELQLLREREIKRQKDLATLHRHRLLAGGLLKKATKQEALCEALQAHLKKDGGLSSVIKEAKHLAEDLQKLAFLPNTATYEEVEAVIATAEELFFETEKKRESS